VPFLSALKVVYDDALYKSTFALLLFYSAAVYAANGIIQSSITADCNVLDWSVLCYIVPRKKIRRPAMRPFDKIL